MRSSRIWRIIKAEVCDNTNRGLNNSSYPARTEFNNCFIIFWKYFKLSLNACFVSKKTQVLINNGTAWNCSKTLISQSDYGKIFLKQLSDYGERSINKDQSIYNEMSHNVVYLFPIYNEMSHNVVYLFSIYDEMSHNVVYLFSTSNLGNYQVDMTISPLALNQSKLLKYFR